MLQAVLHNTQVQILYKRVPDLPSGTVGLRPTSNELVRNVKIYSENDDDGFLTF